MTPEKLQILTEKIRDGALAAIRKPLEKYLKAQAKKYDVNLEVQFTMKMTERTAADG